MQLYLLRRHVHSSSLQTSHVIDAILIEHASTHAMSHGAWAGLIMYNNFYGNNSDKAHKQGMPHSDMHSITRPHHSTIIPTYISNSGMPVGTKLIYCYLCRDAYGCWIMWPCHGVHITEWHSFFVCFVSASAFIDSSGPTSARFLFRNLFMETSLRFVLRCSLEYINTQAKCNVLICYNAMYIHTCFGV